MPRHTDVHLESSLFHLNELPLDQIAVLDYEGAQMKDPSHFMGEELPLLWS